MKKIISRLKSETEVKLVRFISDKGPNSCKDCLKHHGQIFCADTPDKPKLPIHPNCRCKYELLTQEESMICQENMQQVKRQLVDYGNQIAAQATQLLEEYENKIKTRVITSTTNGVATVLTAALQVSLWTMKKLINQTNFCKKKF